MIDVIFRGIPIGLQIGEQRVTVTSGSTPIGLQQEEIMTSKRRIYPDAGHGGTFQAHERFIPEALEFLEA